jgi:hypothetical protein
VGLFACYRLARDSAANGTARLLSFLSIIESTVEPSDMAVKIAPTDPEAHYTRALSLINLGQLNEAVVELREAIRLRPYHYYEWLDLGVTLDRLGDQEGAARALAQAVQLAPAFAQPRWQLGNLLYRQGKFPEAFEQLRLAYNSNPYLLESAMDLAWAAADGNVATLEQLIQPASARSHLELASFLSKHEMGDDAARHVSQAGNPSDEAGRKLIRRTISQLLTNSQFSPAYAVWAISHGGVNNQKDTEHFVNGDFLSPIPQDDPGFGWQLYSVPNVLLSIDVLSPSSPGRSLLLEFSGDNAPGARFISELLLLRPNTNYSASFMTRSEKLVSGGPPVIIVLSADSKAVRILGQSNPMPTDKTDWVRNDVDFSTDGGTSAVVVAVQRVPCPNPCPIFGKLWLANFTLSKK